MWLRDIGGGKQVLLAGQKSGILWCLDPDNNGRILWQLRLGAGSGLGGIEWGDAADGKYAYVAISDRVAPLGAEPGISAVDFATGKRVWTGRLSPRPLRVRCRQAAFPASPQRSRLSPEWFFPAH